jgi:hypothetical protein
VKSDFSERIEFGGLKVPRLVPELKLCLYKKLQTSKILIRNLGEYRFSKILTQRKPAGYTLKNSFDLFKSPESISDIRRMLLTCKTMLVKDVLSDID